MLRRRLQSALHRWQFTGLSFALPFTGGMGMGGTDMAFMAVVLTSGRGLMPPNASRVTRRTGTGAGSSLDVTE